MSGNDQNLVSSCCGNGGPVLHYAVEGVGIIPLNGEIFLPFTSLPHVVPNNLQVDPAAGYIDIGTNAVAGLILYLYGDELRSDLPIASGTWGTFDNSGFSPDTWLDGTGTVVLRSLVQIGDPVRIDYVRAGWVGGGNLHTVDLLPVPDGVPEPSTLGLIGLGLLGLGAMRRRRRYS